MKNFKTFFYESIDVATNKRVGLEHFHTMKSHLFIDWIDSVKKDAKSKLKNIKSVLKVDGLSFKFGKDINGKVFIEGARTGPQFDIGAFKSYAQSKQSIPEIVARAAHYDDILEFFKFDKSIMTAVPNNTKIYCELFYNPMAHSSDSTGIQFVTIKYDKAKLGSLMTILPYGVFDAKTGQHHSDEKKILDNLYKQSNPKVKIIDPSLKMDEINIETMINPLDSLLKDKEETKKILQSRKAINKEHRQNLLTIIQTVKDSLSKHLLFNPAFCGLDKLCEPEKGEGIVLHLPQGSFKITSDEFRNAHAAQKENK